MIAVAYLDRYARLIRRLSDEVSEAWGVIYQADARAREEHWERMRRKAQYDHDEAKKTGGTTPFDEAKPWGYPLRMLTEDHQFWQRELIDPVMMYVVKGVNAKTPAATASSAPAVTSAGAREAVLAGTAMTQGRPHYDDTDTGNEGRQRLLHHQ